MVGHPIIANPGGLRTDLEEEKRQEEERNERAKREKKCKIKVNQVQEYGGERKDEIDEGKTSRHYQFSKEPVLLKLILKR